MIININPDWRLRTDPLQWILEEHYDVESREGESYERWRPVGFHSSFGEALKHLARRRIKCIEGECDSTALYEVHDTLAVIEAEDKETRRTITREIDIMLRERDATLPHDRLAA